VLLPEGSLAHRGATIVADRIRRRALIIFVTAHLATNLASNTTDRHEHLSERLIAEIASAAIGYFSDRETLGFSDIP